MQWTYKLYCRPHLQICNTTEPTISLSCLFVFQERIQLETARLYKLSGVDPLAGTYKYYAWKVSKRNTMLGIFPNSDLI